MVRTEMGTFRFAVRSRKGPETCGALHQAGAEGYYDGSAFFRVVLNGIIQGGDPLLRDPATAKDLWGTGGLRLLKSEISDIKHERGVVSTVRIPSEPDSDGAQFFVCVTAQAALDGQFSAFGRVTEGIEVVQSISQVPAGESGFTEKPVRIESVTIEKERQAPFHDATPERLKQTVTMETTLGTMKIETMPVGLRSMWRQFLNLVAEGWYDHVGFHRIVPGFVFQGGMGYHREPRVAHNADRWIHPLKAEFRDDVHHQRGTISMAHGDDPDDATTSFFVVSGDAAYLDGKFSAFARVVEGLEVLDAFEEKEWTERRESAVSNGSSGGDGHRRGGSMLHGSPSASVSLTRSSLKGIGYVKHIGFPARPSAIGVKIHGPAILDETPSHHVRFLAMAAGGQPARVARG